jgi:hypothetical protein
MLEYNRFYVDLLNKSRSGVLLASFHWLYSKNTTSMVFMSMIRSF